MWYDVLVLAILLVSLVRGAARGVIWQLAGIAGIILCLVFAETISAVGSPYVGLEPPLNQWVVMFVAYLFFSFLSFGFARVLNGAIEKAQLKEYNKHLGALFGVVKGAAFCLVLTFFLVTLSQTTRDMLRSSRSARVAAIVMDRLHPVMPEKLRGALVDYIQKLDADDLDLQYANNQQPAGGDQPSYGSGQQQSPVSFDPFGNPTGQQPTNGGPQSPATDPRQNDFVDRMLQQIPGLENGQNREAARQVYDAIPPQQKQRLLDELYEAGPTMLMSALREWQQPTLPPTNSNPQPSSNLGPSNAGSSNDRTHRYDQPANDPFGLGGNQNVNYSQPHPGVPAPSNSQPANPSGSSTTNWLYSPPTSNQPSALHSQQPKAGRDSLIADVAARLARTPQERSGYQQSISAGVQGLPDAIAQGVLRDWQADLTRSGDDPDPKTNASTSLDQRIIRQLTVQRMPVDQLSQQIQQRLYQAARMQ